MSVILRLAKETEERKLEVYYGTLRSRKDNHRTGVGESKGEWMEQEREGS